MNRDILKQNIWAAAAEASRKNINTLLFVVGVLIAADMFFSFTGETGGQSASTSVIWCFLAYSAHGTVLRGTVGYDAERGNKTLFSFFWRSALLSIVPILVLVPILISAASSSENGAEAIVFGTLLLSSPLYLITFGLFGTSLPAIVDDGQFRIGRTLKRGVKTFFPTIGRLMYGPGLMFCIIFAVALYYPFYQGDGELFAGNQTFQWLNLIPTVIVTLLSAYLTVMIAVILSKAYVSGEEKLGPLSPIETDPAAPQPRHEPTLSDSSTQARS